MIGAPGFVTKLLNCQKGDEEDAASFYDFIHEVLIQNPDSRFPFEQPPPPQPQIETIALKGGGAKVAGYFGVTDALSELGLLDGLKHIIGTSGGGIFGLFFSLGFSGPQITKLFERVSLVDVTDKRGSFFGQWWASTPIAQSLDAIISGHIYSGEVLKELVQGILEFVLGDKEATFRDLHLAKQENPRLKDLNVVATKLKPDPDESPVTLFGHFTTPDVPIWKAFCATLALPGVFPPVEIDGRMYGDGGLSNNFPLDLASLDVFENPRYPSRKVKSKGHPNGISVRDTALGVNLITKTEQLNPDHQELSEPQQRFITEKNIELNRDKRPSSPKKGWTYYDLMVAIVGYAFGWRKPENTEQKALANMGNVAQVYTWDLGTIEFNADVEKVEKVIRSGRLAIKNYVAKHRDPCKPYERGSYRELELLSKFNLTLDECREQLSHTVFDLLTEMYRYDPMDTESYRENLRIANHVYDIQCVLQRMRDQDLLCDQSETQAQSSEALSLEKPSVRALVESVFMDASHQFCSRMEQRRQIAIWLDIFVEPDQFLRYVRQIIVESACLSERERELHPTEADQLALMQKKEEKARTLINTRVGDLCDLATNQSAFGVDDTLVEVAARYNLGLLIYLFDKLSKKDAQLYQTSRLERPFLEHMQSMSKSPFFAANANTNHCAETIDFLWNQGLTPWQKYQGKNAIHGAIDDENIVAVEKYLSLLSQSRYYPGETVFGFHRQPVVHYVIEHASTEFIRQVMALGIVQRDWMNQVDYLGRTPNDLLATREEGISLWAELVHNKPKLFSAVRDQNTQRRQAFIESVEQAFEALCQASDEEVGKLVHDLDIHVLGELVLNYDLIRYGIDANKGEMLYAIFTRLRGEGLKVELDRCLDLLGDELSSRAMRLVETLEPIPSVDVPPQAHAGPSTLTVQVDDVLSTHRPTVLLQYDSDRGASPPLSPLMVDDDAHILTEDEIQRLTSMANGLTEHMAELKL